MMLRRMVLLVLLLVYGLFFLQQERFSHSTPIRLALPMPVSAEKAVLGYLRQLGGEMYFIKTAVYIGGLSARGLGPTGIDLLYANLDSASELNPPFIDTYFYCESFVASQGQEHARQANAILQKGMAALPEDWVLPFFLGFNQFYYLNAPDEAAVSLQAAYKKSKAPAWIGHLATIMAAKGGNIYTGLMWLRAMYEGEEDEAVRRSYESDITDYEKALVVQKALYAFKSRYGREPEILDDLVPEFLSSLPNFKGNFVLNWEPPVLRMERPRVK